VPTQVQPAGVGSADRADRRGFEASATQSSGKSKAARKNPQKIPGGKKTPLRIEEFVASAMNCIPWGLGFGTALEAWLGGVGFGLIPRRQASRAILPGFASSHSEDRHQYRRTWHPVESAISRRMPRPAALNRRCRTQRSATCRIGQGSSPIEAMSQSAPPAA